MIYRSKLRKLRLLLPIALLVMILLRLVWIQIRVFPHDLQPSAIITLNHLTERVDDQCVAEDLDLNLPGIQKSLLLADAQFDPDEIAVDDLRALIWTEVL